MDHGCNPNLRKHLEEMSLSLWTLGWLENAATLFLTLLPTVVPPYVSRDAALELPLIDPQGLPDHTPCHDHYLLNITIRIQGTAWKGIRLGLGR